MAAAPAVPEQHILDGEEEEEYESDEYDVEDDEADADYQGDDADEEEDDEEEEVDEEGGEVSLFLSLNQHLRLTNCACVESHRSSSCRRSIRSLFRTVHLTLSLLMPGPNQARPR